MEVKELAPGVCPARRFGERLFRALIQGVKSRIGIGLQDAAKVLEMRARMLALAIGRIAKENRRGIRASSGSIIPHIAPEPSRLGLAGARREDRNRRVIRVELLGGEHVRT